MDFECFMEEQIVINHITGVTTPPLNIIFEWDEEIESFRSNHTPKEMYEHMQKGGIVHTPEYVLCTLNYDAEYPENCYARFMSINDDYAYTMNVQYDCISYIQEVYLGSITPMWVDIDYNRSTENEQYATYTADQICEYLEQGGMVFFQGVNVTTAKIYYDGESGRYVTFNVIDDECGYTHYEISNEGHLYSSYHMLMYDGNITYYVKDVLTNPDTEALTNEEKAQAQSWLGVKDNSDILETYILNIDYDTLLAFDTSEIVIGATSTTPVLGQAILGQMVLA